MLQWKKRKMRYDALACDYDGTIAENGVVSEETIAAMRRLSQSGRRLILVTGRELPDLLQVFPRVDLFDRVVVENGAVLYRPASRETVLLAEPPPPQFVDYLRRRQVNPLSCGHVIVATCEPNEIIALEAIRALELDLHVIFNKGAVMVLPSGVNKATGLKAALNELGLSAHKCVGVGDGENDHAFLSLCECAVATANAVDLLKERADLVTQKPRGAGVAELINRIIASNLKELEPRTGAACRTPGHPRS